MTSPKACDQVGFYIYLIIIHFPRIWKELQYIMSWQTIFMEIIIIALAGSGVREYGHVF